MDEHLFTIYITHVEEQLNRRFAAGRNPQSKLTAAVEKKAAGILNTGRSLPGLNESSRKKLEDALHLRRRSGTAADYVLSMLPKRGYALKDGQPDCVRFYKQALIAPDVWSTFLSHTHAPSKTTLFRIVFALRMDEDEARKMLSLAGSGFSATDLTDQLVLACLDCGIFDPAVVYEVFEYYREAYAGKGKTVRNIYGAPD